MRRIVATAKVSLDGVMQGEGGPEEDRSGGFDLGGWANAFSEEKAGTAVLSLVGTLEKPNDLLLGRNTYDSFAGYWPFVPEGNPIGPVFTKANKYVVTRGERELKWANSHRIHGVADLKKVKDGRGPDIVLWGSSTLYPMLLDANLIDRLLLLICPIVLGKGKKIFGTVGHPFAPKLRSCTATSTGVIIADYERPKERGS